MSNDDRVRAELVAQLCESLAKSRGMMLNEKLDVKTRERWTQMHTNTAQVLNQILRDNQFREWEKRLKELEAKGRIPRGTLRRVEESEGPDGRQVEGTGGMTGEAAAGKGGS